jgi:glc operon protein GlcG
MTSFQGLDHRDAQLAIQAIQEEILRRGKAAVIAVADEHGELVGILRTAGAPASSIVIASNKAWTAARERTPTRELGRRSRDAKTAFDFAYYGDMRYVGWGGGLPVAVDGAVVGSVAVSGLSEQEDEELAGIGVAAVLDAAARTHGR